MKWPQFLALAGALMVALTACGGKAATPESGMINPGDKVGNFTITTRGGDDVVYITNLHCPFEDPVETCEVPVGTKINISQGFYPPKGSDSFEEAWSSQTYSLVMEGRPVNLPAFGYDEWKHPLVGTIRVWNVVIVANKPGTISAVSSGVFSGEAWNYTAKIIFTKP